MRVPLLAAATVLALALAGCVQPNVKTPATETPEAAASLAEPKTVEWTGHVVVSPGENLAHRAATEPVVAPLYAEGFLFDITEPPKALEVSLAWTSLGPTKMMIMLHAPHGKDGYREFITKMEEKGPLCIGVPPEDLENGKWQVMVHSEDAVSVDFTLKVKTVGGEGKIVPGEPHGHALDEQFKIDERKTIPCEA